MLGISGTELVIILFFGFLIFGPEKLPQMGRTVGRAIRQFREASEAANQKFKDEVYDPFKEAVEPYADKIQNETGGLQEDLKAINDTFKETQDMFKDPLGLKGGSSRGKSGEEIKDSRQTGSIKSMVDDMVKDPLGLKKKKDDDIEESLAKADAIIDAVEADGAERKAAMATAAAAVAGAAGSAAAEPVASTASEAPSKVKKGLAESLYDLDDTDPFADALGGETPAPAASAATDTAAASTAAAVEDPFAELDEDEPAATEGGE